MSLDGFAPRPFLPAWWLPGPHGQTLGARLLRRKDSVPFCRERLETPDGDFLDLDWARVDGRPAAVAGDPLVLVLHGLEGSARSGYACELYRRLADHGVAAVGLNFRSCSGELNRGRRLYHSGETTDAAFVLDLLRRRGHLLAAVGVSLGGNALLKLLGERGADAGVAAAAAISVPFDLAAGADHLEGRFGALYVRRLLASLKVKLRARAAELAPPVDLARALAAGSFRAFDDAATAPLHGFADAADYYQRSSSGRFLERIRVPTLLVHAEDDPFLPSSAIPRAAFAGNPALAPAIVPRGGHVGFVSGANPLAPRFWAETEAARFVARALA